MKKISKLITAGILAVSISNLWASEKWLESLPEASQKQLQANGRTSKIHSENDDSFVLIPDCNFKSECQANRVEKTGMPFVAEQLYIVSKKDLSDNWSTFDIKTVSRIFTSLSKMKGMTYYSNTRKKEVVLYKYASFIDNPGKQNQVSDFCTENSEGLETYLKVNDASFGDNIYKINYHQSDNEIYITLKNVKSMGYGPFKAIMPDNLLMSYLVVDCGESYLVYLGTDINMQKISGVREKISTSLFARLSAVYDWFIKQF